MAGEDEGASKSVVCGCDHTVLESNKGDGASPDVFSYDLVLAEEETRENQVTKTCVAREAEILVAEVVTIGSEVPAVEEEALVDEEKTPEIAPAAAEVTTSVKMKALGAAVAVVEVAADVPQDSAEKGHTFEADAPAAEAVAPKEKAVPLQNLTKAGKLVKVKNSFNV